MKTKVQVYGLHNGRKIYNWLILKIEEFEILINGRSVVYEGRHWWLV
jgi:hypothetical protein